MQMLGKFDNPEAYASIAKRAEQLIATIQDVVRPGPTVMAENVRMISKLRTLAYEDINQLQHEYLILRAARWLVQNNHSPADASWEWHPQQTGDENEPDLQWKEGDRILISAEVTASANPKGGIRTRMKETLTKLSVMGGSRFYFVHTATMKTAAETLRAKNNWPISVVELTGFDLGD
jgi:hypothetical protein